MTLSKYVDKTLTIFIIIVSAILAYLIIGLFRPPIDMDYAASVFLVNETVKAVGVSLGSIAISMVIVAFLGTLLAYKFRKRRSLSSRIAKSLILLPLLLPPTVAGLVLLQGFGRHSLLSHWLFGGQLNVTFNFIGIILTQVYVTLPFFYQMTSNAFEEIEDAYVEAAKVCGADDLTILRYILVPMSLRSMGIGLFMSALRGGLSEFGATMMFAGNMVGKTQTITTRIYQLYQTDMDAAFVLAAFQLCVFLIPYYLFIGRQQFSKESRCNYE